jgi:MATE family multidrug resistance protein
LKKLFNLTPGKGGVAEMLVIALPMIVSTACDGVMTFTDRLFLSRLGSEQMNAAMGGGVAMQMMMFFFIGLTGYTTALVAQYYGSGQRKMTGVASFQAIIIALAAYPIILLCRPLSLHFFNFMHVPAAQLPYQISFFNIIIYGVLFSILRNCLSCYFSGLGRTKVVMMAALVSVVVNVILDYILIFGKLGFPVLGIRGAAIATLTGGFTGLCILIFVYLGRFNRENFGIMDSFKFNWPVMRKLLYFGYPAGLELFLNFLGFSVIIFMFYSRGDEVATATTIMFSWDMASFIPLLGIEIAVTSLVGRYMGAGDPETAHKAAMSGIKTGIYYSAVVLVLFVFIPETLANVFRPDVHSVVFDKALPVATSMIRIASLYVLAEAMMVALVGALRGAGDTHWTMIASVTFHWTFIPLLWVMFHLFNATAVMGWLALVILFLVFCFALYLRYRTGKWKKMRVIEVELPVMANPGY